ncbi:MAG: phage tail tube protein [Pseudomonadota bacterium]
MDCCISAGGIVRITVDGVVYPVRGSVTVMATEIEREEGSNIDGSIYVTSKPVPPTIEATLSDTCGLSLQQLINVKCVDITVELPEVGRTLILINGTIVGRPQLNPENGEISNVKFVGSKMREILADVA